MRPDEDRGTAGSTRDDILNSLTRRAQSSERPTEEGTAHVLEVVDSRGLEGQASLLDNMAGNKRNRHAARWAFLLFLGGFLAVWGYGYLTRAYDIPLLSLVTQNEAVKVGVQAVSANLLPAGLASGVVLLAALLILHRRKG